MKDHYVVKEDAKSVVWREGRFHHLIEKAQIVESGRRSDEGLADRVKADISRTKECAESTVGGRHPEDAKKTSGRRRCDRPAGKVTGLKIAVGDEVCFGGLSYAQPEQANQCQDAVKTCFLVIILVLLAIVDSLIVLRKILRHVTRKMQILLLASPQSSQAE